MAPVAALLQPGEPPRFHYDLYRELSFRRLSTLLGSIKKSTVRSCSSPVLAAYDACPKD
jgi:hypothetical protein